LQTAALSLFLPSSKLSRGNINATFVSTVHGPEVRGDLQYGYRSYLQRIHLFPPLLSVAHHSSNFPYSSSNRPARDSASYIQLDSKLSLDCQSAFVSSLALRCDSYLPVSPCFRVLSSANTVETFQERLSILRTFITLQL